MSPQPFPTAEVERAEEALPSPSTPPDALNPDAQASRKREREISLEPAPAPLAETDPTRRDKLTAKKNRLDPTAEEPAATEEPSSGQGSDSPPCRELSAADSMVLSTSPPHDVKMNQISRRVSNIGWQGSEGGIPSTSQDTPPISQEPALLQAPAVITPAGSANEPATTSDVQDEVLKPASPRRQSMESIRSVGGTKRSREDDPSDEGARPPEAKRSSPSTTPPPAAYPVVETVSEPSMKRRSSDSITGSKRPREDVDKDENPRETKRPSPPPAASTAKEIEAAASGSSTVKEVKTPAVSTSASTSTPSKNGFMAYASTASPFATLAGTNLFAKSPPSTPLASASNPNNSPFTTKLTDSGATKRTGFAAFSGSASPFATAGAGPSSDASEEKNSKRPKSPTRPVFGATSAPPRSVFGAGPKAPERSRSPAAVSAFGSSSTGLQAFSNYASKGAQGFSPFAGSLQQRSRSDTPSASAEGTAAPSAPAQTNGKPSGSDEETGGEENGGKKPVSWSERLREGEKASPTPEERAEPTLSQQDVRTGEEDEDTLYQVRGKLFVLDVSNQWKERGVGNLRLNVRKEDGAGARLVMRKQAVHNLILNCPLFKGMSFSNVQDPRYIRFSSIEEGVTHHYNFKVANTQMAQDLLEEIRSNVPVE